MTGAISKNTTLVDQSTPTYTIPPLQSTHRALGTYEILERILSYASANEHDSYQQVCWSFYNALNNPLSWNRRYYPASIDWPTRTIYTSFDPEADGRPAKVYHSPTPRSHMLLAKVAGYPEPIRHTKKLGTYKNEVWRVKSGAPPPMPSSTQDREILDQVISITRSGGSFYRYALDPEEENELREADRRLAYAFLLDRAYRLSQGTLIPTYREDSLACAKVAPLCLICAGLGFAIVAPGPLENAGEGISAKALYCLALVSGISLGMAGLIAFFCTALMVGTDQSVQNLAIGRRQRKQLDKWAVQFASRSYSPLLEHTSKKEHRLSLQD